MCVSVCVVVFYFTAAAGADDDRSLDGDTMVNTRFAVRKTAPCNVWRGKLPGPECAVSFSCYTYARNLLWRLLCAPSCRLFDQPRLLGFKQTTKKNTVFLPLFFFFLLTHFSGGCFPPGFFPAGHLVGCFVLLFRFFFFLLPTAAFPPLCGFWLLLQTRPPRDIFRGTTKKLFRC